MGSTPEDPAPENPTPEDSAPEDSAPEQPWEAAAAAAAQAAAKVAGAAAKVAQEVAQEGMKRGVRHGMRGDFPGAWFLGGGPPPWVRGPRGHGPRGRGPWGPGAWEAQPKAKKGDVRAAILALLTEEPFNGYQIIQEVDERSGGIWRPSPGAIYPALQQLADEGLIEGLEEAGRKTFHLTDAGRAYVEEHADELRAPWPTPTTGGIGGGIGDLFKEAAQMGGALMQVVHAGSDEQIAEARRLVAATRRRLYGLLAEDAQDPAGDEGEA
jgi:DNA-binding PadR family transcriptional regulator